MVAKPYQDEYIALICALFAYGNAIQIVKFLGSLDFSLLDQDEHTIAQTLDQHYYRFQNAQDVMALFIALSRLKRYVSLETVFYKAYKENKDVLQGIFALIEMIREALVYESKGYRFLVGMPAQNSPYKRWLMFLRWMVRKDHLDMGLWNSVDKKDLLLPLDTHTFKVGHKLGLLKRKSYDLKAVIEITDALKILDPNDPVKYDFALYRLGQEKLLSQ